MESDRYSICYVSSQQVWCNPSRNSCQTEQSSIEARRSVISSVSGTSNCGFYWIETADQSGVLIITKMQHCCKEYHALFKDLEIIFYCKWPVTHVVINLLVLTFSEKICCQQSLCFVNKTSAACSRNNCNNCSTATTISGMVTGRWQHTGKWRGFVHNELFPLFPYQCVAGI